MARVAFTAQEAMLLKRRIPEKPAKSMVELALSVSAPTFSLKFPLMAMRPPPRLIDVLSLTAFSAVTRNEPPLTLMTVLFPMAPAAAAWSVPLLMVVVPVKPVLLPVRI